MLEIEGQKKQINFRAVDAINQEMLLGIDFMDAFDIEADLGVGLWQLVGGRKNFNFVNVKDRSEELLEVKKQVVEGKTGKGGMVEEVEEEMGELQDSVCSVEVVCENEWCELDLQILTFNF